MTPNRDTELELLKGAAPGVFLAGVDEVGRGALAGPVTVGIALVDASCGDFPPGLKDSKQMSAAAREKMVPEIESWVADVAVGHAGPDVVDSLGIMAALRWAAADALAKLRSVPSLVLLDGSYDWWSHGSLFEENALPTLPVHMKVKADASCAVVSAASVCAKVARDVLMVRYDKEYPGYDWAQNKGYSSPTHIQGLEAHGPSALHRQSWKLPGLTKGLT